MVPRGLVLLILAVVAGVGAAGADNPPPGDLDLEITAADRDLTLGTAELAEVRVEVHNRGSQAWTTGDGFALAYHWLSPDGGIVVWDGLRSSFQGAVAPDEISVVAATVRAPDRAGDYLLQWDVVREGHFWISEHDPTPVDPQPVAISASHAFSFVRVSTPRFVRAGRVRPAPMVLRNDGAETWPGDGSISLSYHWLNDEGEIVEWEGARVALTRPVIPGGNVELDAVISAPTGAGRFLLQWDMVDDGVCWFSERDPSPEPSVVVVVIPPVLVNPIVWTVIVFAVASTVVFLSRRGRVEGVWPLADVAWCATALVVKQGWVLAGAGLGWAAAGLWFSIATATILAVVLLLLPPRIRPWISWSIGVVLTAVLFADLVHERFFGDLLSLAAVHSAGQIGTIGASVRSLLEPGDLWFWADLGVVLPLVWMVARVRTGSVPRRVSAVVMGLVAVLCGLLGGWALRGADYSLRQVFHTTHLARQIGVLNLHVTDLGGAVVRGLGGADLGADELDSVVRFFDDRRGSRAGVGTTFGAARGRNLVMIQVESLQAFVVGLRVGGTEVTPFLNRFAADSIHFANVTDQTEEGRSSDSELATQVSLLPPDRGAAAFRYAGNGFTGMASLLGEHGYESLSAVPFDGSFWNRRKTHHAYGYRNSVFADDFGPGEEIGWGLNDRAFLSQAAARLVGLPEPWCAYLLTLSLHHPFEGFPDHLKVLDVGEWEGTPFGNFLHTMHHFDDALAAFVAALDAESIGEKTVIALWGDHDAGFEWRPEIAAAMGVTHDAVGWYLSQQVPLVIRVPGMVGSPTFPVDLPAGHADVAPTLLALLGVDPSPFAFTGRNLLGSPGAGPVVGEYRCWRDATHLYLRRGPSLADGECIELETMKEVDPGLCAASFEAARREVEISNLVLKHDLQQRLRKSLAARP